MYAPRESAFSDTSAREQLVISRNTRIYDERGRERELRIRDRDPVAIIRRIHCGYLVASCKEEEESESIDRRSPDHLRSRSLG